MTHTGDATSAHCATFGFAAQALAKDRYQASDSLGQKRWPTAQHSGPPNSE